MECQQEQNKSFQYSVFAYRYNIKEEGEKAMPPPPREKASSESPFISVDDDSFNSIDSIDSSFDWILLSFAGC